MTIIEALKTDKPFRNLTSNFPGTREWTSKQDNADYFIYEELLSNDWEVLVCEKHNLVKKEFGRIINLEGNPFFDKGCEACYAETEDCQCGNDIFLCEKCAQVYIVIQFYKYYY